MKMRGIVPMLSVRDLARTLGFYRDALGFELVNSFPNATSPSWCMLSSGGAVLMFNQVPSGSASGEAKLGTRFQIFYFYPPDVAALHADLTARKLAVSPLRVTVYGMKEFNVEDPDGYKLLFGEPTKDPPTVKE
jgi:catechol 2,3-dioxygenase-like lactoylglutathione lyase family enzyme